MNKTIKLLLCLVLLLSTFSCGQKAEEANSNVKKEVSPELKKLRSQIKKVVDKHKSDTSTDAVYGYKVNGVSFDNKVVKIDYEVGQSLHIDSLIKHENIYDEIFYYCLIKDFMANGEFLGNLVQAKVNILWTVSSTESKTKINHIITCGKLRKLLTNNYPPVELAKLQLKSSTAVGNAGLPIKRDESTLSAGCRYDGKDVVYENTILENDVYDLSNPVIREKLLEVIKPSMIQNIKNNSAVRASISQLFELCVTADARMVYNYRGNKSGRKISISFTPAEMKSILDSFKTKK